MWLSVEVVLKVIIYIQWVLYVCDLQFDGLKKIKIYDI